jgi:hypothetical protein
MVVRAHSSAAALCRHLATDPQVVV